MFATVACGQILGVDRYGTHPSAADAAPERDASFLDSCGHVYYASEPCRDCVTSSCCGEARACDDDPGCAAMIRCLAQCGPADHACRGGCNVHIVLSSGVTALSDLTACEASSCEACPSARVVVGGASCDACIAERCPEAADDFSRDRNAMQLVAYGCAGDPGCEFLAEYASGQAHVDAIKGCAEGACATECKNSKPDWSCLGKVQWPPLAGSVREVREHVRIVSYASNLQDGLPGFTVEACDALELACGVDGAVGTSGPEGWVTLTIPRPSGPTALPQPGFFDHLRATPPVGTSYADEYQMQRLFLREPRSWDNRSWGIGSRKDWDNLAKFLDGGASLDPTKGQLVFFGDNSCSGGLLPGPYAQGLPGVRISIPSGEPVVYLGGTTDQTGGGKSIALISNVKSLTGGAVYHVEARLATPDPQAATDLVGIFDVMAYADSASLVELAPTSTGM